MPRDSSWAKLTRRRFAFWFGLGLFSLGEKLNAQGLDSLAAAIMRSAETEDPPAAAPEHWRVADNRTWWWYERETFVDGRWKVSGMTTPINKETGQSYTGHSGYLDERLVPSDVRLGYQGDDSEIAGETGDGLGLPRPDPDRRARHGRPPSKWLRSLQAEEIRTWLRTIEVPEAGVSGMTYWTHLTRDHSFDPKNLAGLSEDEQAKLHAAAHHGY
jgi:hypothetical protein